MENKDKKKSQLREYAKYSGMATEMFGLLLVLVFIGRYIDKQMGNPKFYITALLVLIGTVAYLYKLYLQLTKSGKK